MFIFGMMIDFGVKFCHHYPHQNPWPEGQARRLRTLGELKSLWIYFNFNLETTCAPSWSDMA